MMIIKQKYYYYFLFVFRFFCEVLFKQLLKCLAKYEYPLDESLKLCRKYNKIEAVAYILERTGAVDEALDIYSNVNC